MKACRNVRCVVMLAQLLLAALPWAVRRRLLVRLYGYEIDPTARIGHSVVKPRMLRMAAGSSIGHLTMCRGMDLIDLGEGALIGPLNWIYGMAPDADGPAEPRVSELVLGEHAHITSRHLIDCSASIRLGRFSLIAGYRSQLITHGIDVRTSRQRAKPIDIGEFAMVTTSCVIVGGARLPARSVLGANSALVHSYTEPYVLYSGVPAMASSVLPRDSKFFSREVGTVTW